MLFTEKHSPKEWNQFIGNSEILEKTKKWAEAWEKGKPQKPLLFYGSPGNGKTALALLTAGVMNWDLFELNASDFRTKEIIERLAGAASQGASFSGKKRLILLDEIDGLQRQDRGGAGAVSKILKNSNNPVILTANDIYANQKLAAIRSNSELLHFKKINYLSIAKYLREICEKELISFDEEAVKELAKNSEGDLRAALLDLQSLSFEGKVDSEKVKEIDFRQRNENVFNIIRKIFRSNSLQEIREARYKSEVDSDLLMQWIHENIPREFKETDISAAMDFFSKGDVFEGRIFKRQNYGFKRYSYDLMSAGATLSRENQYSGWTQYMFPQLIKSLSASKSVRTTKLSLCKKIAKKIHSSSKGVMQNELSLIQEIFSSKGKEKPIQLAYLFGFDENEIAFLMNTKPETKKVQTILESAQKLKEKSIKKKRFTEEQFARFEKTKPEKEIEIPEEKSIKETGKKEISEKKKQKPKKEEGKQTTLFSR